MGIVTSLIGKSGSGKSRSMKTMLTAEGTFPPEVFVVRMGKKPMPFKNKLRPWDMEKKVGDYLYISDGSFIPAVIEKFSNENGKKVIIIDDSTFAMTNYFMATALKDGWGKFTNNALMYFNILTAAENTPEDCRVYLVNHVEDDSSGNLKIKTIGRMLDEKVDIVSKMTIVLQSESTQDGYKFITNQRQTRDIAKSPEEMFQLLIDNDLKFIDDSICDYYEYQKIKV